ncbi:hypothetical protein KKA15_01875 [Patescibacteria group bacterium]|nr:hypothetical protein [Patescibacteria group bacterium]
MPILITLIIAVVVGYITSLKKKRFPIWIYMLTAFFGALAGTLISFGDSALFLNYPILNIWTVPVILSILFSLVAIFADRGKMILTVISIFIIITGIAGFIYIDSSPSDYSGLFREELSRAGAERVGQPIEGFNAFIYLEAFPGFIAKDFDGVKSFEGIYNLNDTELEYTRTAGNPITSAEETISEEGYKILLVNFSKRVGVEVNNEKNIATLLDKLREGDPELVSYIGDDFSIWFPEGWYAHENNSSVFFTHDEILDIPKNTESFAAAPWAQITISIIDIDELFAQNLWTDGSGFVISKNSVRIDNMEAIRIVTEAGGTSGEVLSYVFNPDERVFIVSHYPYIPRSQDTDEFEQAVRTFMVNYNY